MKASPTCHLKVPASVVKVVGRSRDSSGSANAVFPTHVGGAAFSMKSPRNGHGGSNRVTSKKAR